MVIRLITKDGKVFSRKDWSEEKELAVRIDDDGEIDTLELYNMGQYKKLKTLDEKLELALEAIETLRQLEDGDPIVPWVFIEICNNERWLFSYDELGEYEFTEVEDKEVWAQEFVNELGILPDDLPSWIEDNINWYGVAEDLMEDYNYCQLTSGHWMLWRQR